MIKDDATFYQRAYENYDNPHCVSLSEFEDDLIRFSYIKKILTRYHATQEINERLFLNHMIVCFNLFGDASIDLLIYKIDKEHWSYLFSFLDFLDRLPTQISGVDISDIKIDINIKNKLRKI